MVSSGPDKYSGQGDNPNVALTRPRAIGLLTLVDQALVVVLDEKHLAITTMVDRLGLHSRHFGGLAGYEMRVGGAQHPRNSGIFPAPNCGKGGTFAHSRRDSAA